MTLSTKSLGGQLFVSFFFIHSCQNYYTQKIFVTALFIVSGNFFFQRNEIQQVDMFFLGNVNKNIMNSQILFLGKYILINSWKINSSKSIDLPKENYCPYVRIIIIIPSCSVDLNDPVKNDIVVVDWNHSKVNEYH